MKYDECHALGDALTYDEWKDLDFHVIKGEKSSSRNAKGIATFRPDQVEENEDYRSGSWDGNEDE